MTGTYERNAPSWRLYQLANDWTRPLEQREPALRELERREADGDTEEEEEA